MEQRKPIVGWLIGWMCFVGFVTWVDSLGLIAYMVAGLPLGFSKFMLFGLAIVLLIGLRVVLRRKQLTLIPRMIVALSLVWLLVLPLIPWTAEKALIVEYSMLIPGMPRPLAHAIMTAYPGIHDPGFKGQIFCAEAEWKDRMCPSSGTYVITHMAGDMFVFAEIELD